jgi:hypothetical protein
MADVTATKRSGDVKSYREMAESCRKMATVSRRPGPLILRAEALEAAALELERQRSMN